MIAALLDLPGFLLARYSEREAALRMLLESKVSDELPELGRGLVFFIEAHDDGCARGPGRELFADLAAKRAIVERHLVCEQENALYSAGARAYEAWTEEMDLPGDMPETAEAFRCVHSKPPPRTTTPFETDGLRIAVRLLAQAYSDHPDFRLEWRNADGETGDRTEGAS